jgi:hypothetical protein
VLSEAIRKGEIGGGSGSKIRDQSRKVEVVEEELGAVLESGGRERESQMLEKEWF